ncbi:hypothetical protein AAFF_G00193400 [Aldrovandia affinis]|uniref:Uncharacterized protein n=1 Tax=Aldrovandia affinis TaxID=143900 RepID=A0AAD7SZA8_9TELE|nr:hypothetical protein AAFF_G00193400 [Aldrovandia affinis]
MEVVVSTRLSGWTPRPHDPSRSPTGQREVAGKRTRAAKDSVTGCLQMTSLHSLTTEGQYCRKREYWTNQHTSQ